MLALLSTVFAFRWVLGVAGGVALGGPGIAPVRSVKAFTLSLALEDDDAGVCIDNVCEFTFHCSFTPALGVAVFSFTAIALGQRSIDESFFGGVVSADMLYFKLFLIGCLMLFSLKFNTKGLLPEVPVRPERPNGGESVE